MNDWVDDTEDVDQTYQIPPSPKISFQAKILRIW